MDKYKRYFGVLVFIASIALMLFITVTLLSPKYAEWTDAKDKVEQVTQTLEQKRSVKMTIVKKLKKLKQSVMTSQKKIYSPVEDKLGDDSLFFTLYNDLIEMVHANTIKIKSIDYQYNPSGDIFVEQKGRYFVCDVNMEVVSNYVNLGKLIQDIYQYPYYIRINKIEVIPYPKDKTILLSAISMRLYAHTSPEESVDAAVAQDGIDDMINGATKPLPKD
jgi:hypothetical protein